MSTVNLMAVPLETSPQKNIFFAFAKLLIFSLSEATILETEPSLKDVKLTL